MEERRADGRRYQAFREALLRLAAGFHSYGPLLTAIASEADLYADHLKRQLDALAPLQVRRGKGEGGGEAGQRGEGRR